MQNSVPRRWKAALRKASLLLCVASALVTASAKPPKRADLSRLVVIGDSLSAGVQNISLEGSQQVNGYVPLIARQAGVNMILPLIAYPGTPNRLDLADPKFHTVTPAAGTLPSVPRLNPTEQPTNLSVPGFTLFDTLNRRVVPGLSNDSPDRVGFWANTVLGYPYPLNQPGPNLTQLEQALAQNPTTLIAAVGNNDVLVSAMVGIPQLLTPAAAFESMYKTLLDALDTSKATLIVATIPDVTRIPYFTSTETLADENAVSMRTIREKLGLSNGDYVRPSALKIVDDILHGTTPGPLPAICPSPIAAFPVPVVPCTLSAVDARIIQDRIAEFNHIIRRQAAAHDAVVVDIYDLVNDIAKKGIKAGKQQLTTEYLGGLFSFDGIHPDNTGYAIIANEFIDTMNKKLKTRIPSVSLEQVFEQDPMRQWLIPGR
jgi:lysophospholipase L1-like esterase